MDYRYTNDDYYYYNQKQELSINRSSSTGTMDPRYQQYYQEYDWYYNDNPQPRRRRNKIDRMVNLHIDGEPMNDLEVIAAKNAAKNQRQSKIVYEEFNTFQELTPQKLPPDTLQVLQETSQMEDAPKLQDTPKLQNTSQPQELTDDEVSSRATRKKRWPFSFLFRTPIKNSVSTPPTPVLSPDNGSTLCSNSQFEQEQDGYWTFKYPTLIPVTPIWIKFDDENQKRISEHVKSTSLDGIQLNDSHICNGQFPIVVIPSQLCCYVLNGMVTSQSFLQLNFISIKK